MVKGHNLQLWCCPQLLYSFKWFIIKAVIAHYLIIQKKMDKLFAKGAIELATGGAGFYSSVFVVPPKCTSSLQTILSLMKFNHFMHIPTFKMPTTKQVWQLM